MANVYSVLIAHGILAANTAPGRLLIGSPPSGYKWVVRSVCFFPPTSTWRSKLDGVGLLDSSGAYLCYTPPRASDPYATYLYDLHQTIEPNDQLFVWSDGNGWAYRISGYQLELP